MRVGNDPDGSGIGRAFFAFNLQSLAGKQVRNVKFLTTMKHSYSCTSTPVSLWRSYNLNSSGKQAWSSSPGLLTWLQELSGHAHKPSTGAGCGDDPQDDMDLEFAANALRANVDSAKGTTNYTLALSARQSDGSSESTTAWWKKFDPAKTKLTVEYNTPPNTPSASQMQLTPDYTAAAVPCVTGSGRPLVRALRPWMKAIVTDPDGVNGYNLRADFALQKAVAGVWQPMTLSPSYRPSIAPGQKAELQISTTLASGNILRWQVKTSDQLGGSSDWSGSCEFQVDTVGPQAAPSVVSTDGLYPPETPDDVVHGNKGRSGKFTLGPNGQTDVASYTYSVNAGSTMTATPAAVGGSVTVWVTPNKKFDNVLVVRSKDKAGNISAPAEYTFLVDEANAAIGSWNLDEGTGTAASGQPGPALQLANGPAWAGDRFVGAKDGVTAKAVQFNGVNQSADSSAAVLDTSKSFSVSAWVKLDKIGTTYQTILSQEGSTNSAFYLQAAPASVNHFRFVRQTADSGTFTSPAAVATSAQVAGVWTHLAGVYDAGTQELRIYVNGLLEGRSAYDPAKAWNATGPTHVGRSKYAGVPSDFSTATIGEVRVWDRVTDPAIDLIPLAEPVEIAKWEMDSTGDDAPRKVADDNEAGYDRPLTLSENPHATKPGEPATQWTGDGYNFSEGLLIDGVSGYAETSEQVVRTDQSFSVAAWVRRDSNVNFQSVWGQDGDVNSSAFLRYQDNVTDGQWIFGMRTKDDATGTGVAAWAPGTTAKWTHLVGVYDAAVGELRIYVDGVLKDRTSYRPTWGSTGAVSVGRVKYLGVNDDSWNGAIDRVRVWQGAISQDVISGLFLEP